MAKKKPDKLDEFLDSLTENATAEEILQDGSILRGFCDVSIFQIAADTKALCPADPTKYSSALVSLSRDNPSPDHIQ